jgi:uncharacterized protein YndB with AHSA1/START domain
MTKAEIVYVTIIDSTPEKVYAALLDGELTKLYWGRHRNVSDWKPGSGWSHVDYDDATRVDVEGQVVEADPPKRLVLTWQSAHPAFREEGASRVTFEVTPFFGAVRLTVTHAELGPKALEGVKIGWPVILSSLKTLLETGKPLAMTTRRFEGPPPK